MDRRSLIKGAAAIVPAAYVWIPKISIASLSGDSREAVVKSRKVMTDLWNLEAVPAKVAEKTSPVYSTGLKTSWAKLEENNYVDREDFRANRKRSRPLAVSGSFRGNKRDYCNSYFSQDDNSQPIAYISTIPYIMQSYAMERAARSLSSSSTVDYFYPIRYIEVFDAHADHAPKVPARIICRDAVWVSSYKPQKGRSGNGVFRVTRTRDVQLIYEEHFEYDFS